MKIFLSYGHDVACHDIAHLIKNDLEALGHEVWFDKERIDFGQEWRREIVEGIHSSQHMLALLSEHSTRDPGVCRDEIAIALGAPGTGRSYVLCILVQPESVVNPPLSVSHIQWLDMHDWRERKAADEKSFASWYGGLFEKIKNRIEHPDNAQFAGETSDLELWLKPIDCTGDIIERVQSFTGRSWLLDDIEAWRASDTDSRLYWLTGGPGQGKSAVAAALAHRSKRHVVAAQFCRFDRPERRDPAMIIRSIAFQIATRLPEYRKHLHGKPGIEDLQNKNAKELFDFLLADPLRFAVGARSENELVILDALDETLDDGRSDLLDLISRELPRLPSWLKFLVTSRPEPAIRRQLLQFGIHEISADDQRNVDDLKEYASNWLGSLNLSPDRFEKLVRSVVEACDGNFLYLRRLQEAVTRGQIDIDAINELPAGLSALYQQEFQHRFPDKHDYGRNVVPILEILLASSRPVPVEDLDGILDISKRSRADTLERLGSLFPIQNGTVSFFHKSLSDWLGDEDVAGPAYFIERQAGNQVLGKALWEQFIEAEPSLLMGDYAIDELPVQLLTWSDKSLSKLCALPRFSEHHQKVENFAFFWQEECNWVRSENWWRLSLRFAERVTGPGDISVARSFSSLGRLLSETGKYAEAQACFTRSLQIQETTLGNSHSDIAETLDALGQAVKAMAMLDEAQAYFGRALNIRESMPSGEPDELITSLNNLGELLDARGAFAEVGQLYDRGLRLLSNQPGVIGVTNAAFLNNVAILKLRQAGGLISGKGAPLPMDLGENRQAEILLRRALGAFQRNAQHSDNTDVARLKNNLAICLQSMGLARPAELMMRQAFETCRSVLGARHSDTATCQNNLAALLDLTDGASDAIDLYQEALSTYESSFGTGHPHVARCLSNFGTFLHGSGDFKRAEQNYRRALQIFIDTLGASHCDTGQVLSNLSMLHLHIGNLYESRVFAFDALSTRRAALGDIHPQTALSYIHIGHLQCLSGNLVEADQSYRAGHSTLSNWVKSCSPFLLPLTNKMLETSEAIGDVAGAERCRAWLESTSTDDQKSNSLICEQEANAFMETSASKLQSTDMAVKLVKRYSGSSLRMQLFVQDMGFTHPLLNTDASGLLQHKTH